MDGRRHESLNDDPLNERASGDEGLDRELEALLGVDPSPSFVARTRARVKNERIHATGGLAGPVAWAGGVAAVVVAAIWLGPAAQPTPPSAGLPDIVLAPPAVVAPPVETPRARAAEGEPDVLVDVVARGEPARPAPEATPIPAVVIAPEEVRGFELLLAGLDRGLIDGSNLSEEWGRLDEDARVVIDVMPIEIVPLMPLARPEGERP